MPPVWGVKGGALVDSLQRQAIARRRVSAATGDESSMPMPQSADARSTERNTIAFRESLCCQLERFEEVGEDLGSVYAVVGCQSQR